MSSALKKGGTTKDSRYLRSPNTSYSGTHLWPQTFLVIQACPLTVLWLCMTSYCPSTLTLFNFNIHEYVFLNSMQYALKLETNSMTFIHKNIWCFGEKKKKSKISKMASSSTVMLFKSDTFLGGHGCMDHLLVYIYCSMPTGTENLCDRHEWVSWKKALLYLLKLWYRHHTHIHWTSGW